MQCSIAELSGRYSPDPVRKIAISDYRMLNRNTSETMPGWQSRRFKSLICGAKDWASMKCRRSCNAILPIAKKSPPGSGSRSKNWFWHNWHSSHFNMDYQVVSKQTTLILYPASGLLADHMIFQDMTWLTLLQCRKKLKNREKIIITPSGTSMT